jgi:hypothetical protein
MGREVAHISTVYRETIADEWLKAIAAYVPGWLLGAAGGS